MDCPVMVKAESSGYTAISLYWPQIRVTAGTREEALRSAQTKLAEQFAECELRMVPVPGTDPWAQMIGKYAGDEELPQIVSEAYAERDRDLVE